MKQIDERTIMFARMRLVEGTESYKDYYTMHPEHQVNDDYLRSLLNLCQPGTAMYNPITAPLVDANFEVIEHIKEHCEGPVNPEVVPMSPEEATILIKKVAHHYGADLVGITRLKPEHYYSYRGRNAYGEKIENHHRFGIVIAMEMSKEMVNRAPKMSTVIETSNIYLRLGVIGLQLATYLRSMGYPARNHMDGNYLVVAPLVAQSAGLGEIGRHGLLLTPEFGGRVRLGVVSTDLELIPDEAETLNISEFCDHCGRCIRTCPGKAIPSEKAMIDGNLRYQINQEKCYEKWRSLGTDCGICLSSCPMSQGVDLEKLKNKAYSDIIQDYVERFPIRPYIREDYF